MSNNIILSQVNELSSLTNNAKILIEQNGSINRYSINALNMGYTPQKGIDYWTEADQESIVQQVVIALGTPVFGRVDTNNNIILTGNLIDGTYTIKYEDAGGNMIDIGTLDYNNGIDYNIPIQFYSGKIDYNNNGIIEQANNYAYSDLISIEDSKEYYFTANLNEGVTFNSLRIAYYDINNNYLSITNSIADIGADDAPDILETIKLPMITAAAGFRLRFSLNSYQVDGNDNWYTGAKDLLNKNAILTWSIPEIGSYTNILNQYSIDLNQRWSASAQALVSCTGMIHFTIPWSLAKGKIMRFKGFSSTIKASNQSSMFYWTDAAEAKCDMSFWRKADESDHYGSDIWSSNGIWETEDIYAYHFNYRHINGFTNADAVNLHISLPLYESTVVNNADLDGLIITIDEPIDVKPYTNQINYAVDSEGNLLNGTGYQTASRISSGGTQAVINNPDAPQAVFTTGFIPVEDNCVIRFKNCFIDVADSNNESQIGQPNWSCNIGFYQDPSTAGEVYNTVIWTLFDEDNSWVKDVVMSGTMVTEFTLKETVSTSNHKYMRLTLIPATKNPADAIVTVNEKII